MNRSVADLGELEHDDDTWRVRFTRRFPHPPEKVWMALTDRDHLNEWFPTDIEGDWTPGKPLRFLFRENEGPDFDGEVVSVEPPRLLEFRWGDEDLRFELQPDGNGTRFTLLVSFDEPGKVVRDSAGWHQCLLLLGHALDGETPPPAAKDAWKELSKVYKQTFPPETATIGPPPGMGDDD